ELQERLPYPTVAAQVVGLDSTNWYRSIVINKGRKNGLAADMGVVTPAGAVGRIVKAYDRFAIVLLLNDLNNAITGLVQRTRDEGIVEGTEKGLARIKYLPLLSTVKVGDQVVPVDRISIFGVRPDLPLVAVCLIGLYHGEIDALLAGIAIGFAQDLFSGGVHWGNLCLKPMFGVIAGLASRNVLNLTGGFAFCLIMSFSVLSGTVMYLLKA